MDFCELVFLILCQKTPQIVKSSVLSTLQLCYLTFIIIVRPFSFTKDNIIGIINEVLFFILSFGLWYLNEKKRWNKILTSAYTWIISFNSMIILTIVVLDIIIRCIKKYKKCRKPSQIQARAPTSITAPSISNSPLEEEKEDISYYSSFRFPWSEPKNENER